MVRKSYSRDICFKVVDFLNTHENKKLVLLKGIDIRLCADAPIEDLEPVDSQTYLKIRDNDLKNCESQVKFILKKRNLERYQRTSYHLGNKRLLGPAIPVAIKGKKHRII